MQIPKYIEIKVADKTVAFLSPKNDGLKDVYVDARLNSESTLEFSLPSINEKVNEITPECEIWTDKRVYNLLKDESIDEVMDESGKMWTKFMAVERWNLLDTEYVEPYISNDPSIPTPADLAVIIVGAGNNLTGNIHPTGTAAHALYTVLQGSEWSMGICDVEGIHDLEMEKQSRLTIIKEIQNTWGGFLVWDSINKVVHLRNELLWQNYTGFQIRYSKNLKHITRTQSNKLVTKLYCFGKDDLDIASINGGLKYLTDFSYTDKVYANIYNNPDIEDAEELMQLGLAELAVNCQPRYNYQVKIVDLRTLPEYSHEDFTLGDMADVINSPNLQSPMENSFKADYKYLVNNMIKTVDEYDNITVDEMTLIKKYYTNARLIRHKYNLFKPWDCELELGDPLERLVEQLKASFDTNHFIDKTFDSIGNMSGQKLVDGSVINNKIADAAIEASKLATKQIILTGDIWSNNNPSNGYIAWNAHKIAFNGVMYEILGGNTNKKYIVWRKSVSADTYQTYTEEEFSAVTLADDEFLIVVNNAGIHDVAWYSRLARQFIGSVFIAEAAIKEAQIANLAVTSAKIADLAVTNAKIGTAAIKSANIEDLSVTTLKIGDTAITEAKIAALAVTTNKIADLAVTNAKIDSLSANKITAGTITALISIMSPQIYSGKYYGPNSSSAFAKVGGSISSAMGDFTLYRGGTTPSEVFKIYDDATQVLLYALGGSILRTIGSTTFPKGTWDFSECTVSNLNSVAKFA